MGAQRIRGGVALVIAATALIAAAPASALTTQYHPDLDARNFAGSAGGWTGETQYSLANCIEGLTCPAIDNTHEPSGGADGGADGYLRSDVSSLASLLTTATVTWQSPSFTYGGAGGQVPDTLTFSAMRRSDAGALLGLLDAARYSLHLDRVGGGGVTLVNSADLTDSDPWVPIPEVGVDPAALVVGDQYRIRIETVLELPVSVIPNSNFGWDNVVLTARKQDVAGGGGGGRQYGYGVDLPGDRLRPADLRDAVGGATLKGNRLHVKVRCPRKAEKPCKFTIVGRIGGKKSAKATSVDRPSVRPGRKGVAKLKVKKAYLPKVREMKKMVFTGTVRSGKVKRKFVRRLPIAKG